MPHFEREDHYWLIELIVYWEGGVNSSHLVRQFGFSAAQAKKYLGQYQQQHPANLHYSPSAKLFLPTCGFKYRQISGDVSEYLDWLNQHSTQWIEEPNPSLTNALINLPKRSVSPLIMRALIQAMKQQRGVDIDYVSMTNPQGQSRIIYPHTFVKTGLRWHLRAYCEIRDDYADFVLSRFRGEPCVEDVRTVHCAASDTQWNKSVAVYFKPNPLLTPAQKTVIEQDYQMQNGYMYITCRAALVHYLLQEMQVNIFDTSGNPAAQPLVVADPQVISPYLFDSNQSQEVGNG